MMTQRCQVFRLFLRKGCDLDKAYQQICGSFAFVRFGADKKQPEWIKSEKSLWQNEPHYLKIWLEFLRDQDIDVDQTFSTGLTFLQTLIMAQYPDFPDESEDSGDRDSTELISILCAQGANVSAIEPDHGERPLHLVCGIPYSPEKAFYVRAQFEILLSSGADPCARNGQGLTVTEVAGSSGWEEQWFEALDNCNKHQVVLEQKETEISGPKDIPLDNTLSKSSIIGLSRWILHVAIGWMIDAFFSISERRRTRLTRRNKK